MSISTTVIEGIEFEGVGDQGPDGGVLVVKPRYGHGGGSRRCGRCGCKSPWYDPAGATPVAGDWNGGGGARS